MSISSALAKTELKAFTLTGNILHILWLPVRHGLVVSSTYALYLLPPAAQELSLCWKCFLKNMDSLRVADVSAMSKRAVDRKQKAEALICKS